MSNGRKNKMLRKITKVVGVLCFTTVFVISAIMLHLAREKNHPPPSHRNPQDLRHLQSLIASNAVNVRRVPSLSGDRSDPETPSEHDSKDALTSNGRSDFLKSPDIDHGHSHNLNVPKNSLDQPQNKKSGAENSLDEPPNKKSGAENSLDQPQKKKSGAGTSLDQPQNQKPDPESPRGRHDKVNVSETSDDPPDNLKPKEDPEFQALHRKMGIGGKAVLRPQKERSEKPPRIVRTQSGEQLVEGVFYTHDDWPQFSFPLYKKSIPKSPYDPPHAIQWDFNVTAFLRRPDVQGKPPKLITWMAPMGYLPSLPEPVRLRTCPDMPCRMTTNKAYMKQSAALIWNGQNMRAKRPPERTTPDQVFVFHNQERPEPNVMAHSTYRNEAWRSAFNWTMSFRFDSDILDVYGYLSKRPVPVVKNYTAIWAAKTNMAAWLVSHCSTHGRREQYAKMLGKFVPFHIYGSCGKYKCERNKDDDCFQSIQSKYKFLLAFENGICQDYITEKFFRYLEADLVLVARGGQGYEKHAPRGTFINTADFPSVQDLANHLVYLDQHPEEYLKILRAKDQYVPMYEEYPHRNRQGAISFMHYHYEAVAYCELCRRLWNLDAHRKTYPDLRQWFDKGNCVKPTDLH